MTPLDKFFFGFKIVTLYLGGALGIVITALSILAFGTPLGFIMLLLGIGCMWFSSNLSKTLAEEIKKQV